MGVISRSVFRETTSMGRWPPVTAERYRPQAAAHKGQLSAKRSFNLSTKPRVIKSLGYALFRFRWASLLLPALFHQVAHNVRY